MRDIVFGVFKGEREVFFYRVIKVDKFILLHLENCSNKDKQMRKTRDARNKFLKFQAPSFKARLLQVLLPRYCRVTADRHELVNSCYLVVPDAFIVLRGLIRE